MTSSVAPLAPPPLVLASTSPYRRMLLDRLGVPFTAAAPDCDEDAYKASATSPRGLAETLALAKAESLRATHPDALILGGDQVATLDDDILGKPGTRDAAIAQLERLAGRTHLLITAVALLHHHGRLVQHTDVARLTLRPLTRAQIERYVDADTPLDCAGSYKLEARGIALFASIDTADTTAITGLPLLWLTGALAGLGFEIP
ncbi:Maf family protein [Chondromyces apiculatus]|nr:nucleoside triphosphate pyrophosphatase [Chondromyces apiculatus]